VRLTRWRRAAGDARRRVTQRDEAACDRRVRLTQRREHACGARTRVTQRDQAARDGRARLTQRREHARDARRRVSQRNKAATRCAVATRQRDKAARERVRRIGGRDVAAGEGRECASPSGEPAGEGRARLAQRREPDREKRARGHRVDDRGAVHACRAVGRTLCDQSSGPGRFPRLRRRIRDRAQNVHTREANPKGTPRAGHSARGAGRRQGDGAPSEERNRKSCHLQRKARVRTPHVRP
jgi:hypothetical protein